jgi:hypothetical protein
MRDIPVAADHDFTTARFQARQMRQEHVHEAELRQLTFFARRAGRAVDRNHAEIAVVALDVAAFGVELGIAEAGDDRVGFVLRVDAGAGIALLFGVVKVPVIAARREQVGRHVGRLGLQFLDADHVGVLFGHPVEEAFFGGGADTVQIGGDNF